MYIQMYDGPKGLNCFNWQYQEIKDKNMLTSNDVQNLVVLHERR